VNNTGQETTNSEPSLSQLVNTN